MSVTSQANIIAENTIQKKKRCGQTYKPSLELMNKLPVHHYSFQISLIEEDLKFN